jgi:hypothetical protein
MGPSHDTLRDPDDIGWLFQETTTRLPGTIAPERRPTNQLKIWAVRYALEQPQRVQITHRTGRPTKNWPGRMRLVDDHGAGRAGSANVSSPTDSWEELNHAL